MLFSEVYGSYYRVVAAVLTQAVDGTLTGEELEKIVQEKGFAESVLAIPAALRDGTWPLLTTELTTPLRHKPTMPLIPAIPLPAVARRRFLHAHRRCSSPSVWWP